MDIRAVLAGLTFALIWSSAFTSARIIVTNAPPLSVSALRFLIAGTIAVLLARVLGQSMRLTRQQWRLTIVFGICQNALYLGLNFVAMQWVQASLASMQHFQPVSSLMVPSPNVIKVSERLHFNHPTSSRSVSSQYRSATI